MPVPKTRKMMTRKAIRVKLSDETECAEAASAVLMTPYTTQGCLPISVVNHPARIAIRPAGP